MSCTGILLSQLKVWKHVKWEFKMRRWQLAVVIEESLHDESRDLLLGCSSEWGFGLFTGQLHRWPLKLTPHGEIKHNQDDFPSENWQHGPLTGLPVGLAFPQSSRRKENKTPQAYPINSVFFIHFPIKNTFIQKLFYKTIQMKNLVMQ